MLNTDPGCCVDPDKAFNDNLRLEITMAPGGSTGHPDQHGTSAAWFLNTNTAWGGRPDPGHPHGLWW